VIVDVKRDDALDRLEHWANEGAVGVRLPPLTRSLGGDPLAIWRKASELGLLVSSLGNVSGFASPEFESVIAEFPDMPIVIEHLAGVHICALLNLFVYVCVHYTAP